MKSGKDTLGAALAAYYDIPIYRFATPLKAAHAALGLGDGETVKDRKWLQEAATILTDRDPGHFVKLFAKQHPDITAWGAVVADMRKPAEFAYLKAKGAVMVKLVVPTEVLVERGSEVDRMDHITEKELDFLPDEAWDVTLLHPWHNHPYRLEEIDKYATSISAVQVIEKAVKDGVYQQWCQAVRVSPAYCSINPTRPTPVGALAELTYWLSRGGDEASAEDGDGNDLKDALAHLAATAYQWYEKLVSPEPVPQRDSSLRKAMLKELYDTTLPSIFSCVLPTPYVKPGSVLLINDANWGAWRYKTRGITRDNTYTVLSPKGVHPDPVDMAYKPAVVKRVAIIENID